MQSYVRMRLEVMDGTQIRMLQLPSIDYAQEWANFESLLFPSPPWDDYR